MKRFHFLLIAWFSAITISSEAQLRPVHLNCSEVGTDGSVKITWVTEYSTVEFAAYKVYYSKQRVGPYSLLDSITDIASTSYTHFSAQANDQNAYYYNLTLAVTGQWVISDTISAIGVSHSVEGQSIVHLVWDSLLSPVPATLGYYNVHLKVGSGSWNVLDSTTETHFSDTTFICEDRYYKITVNNDGCESVSSIENIPQDITQPAAPRLDSVSINANGKVVLGWTPTITDDVQGYYIFRQYDSGIWDTLETIYGVASNFYTDPSLNPYNGKYRFCVAAFDMCGNTTGDMGITQAQQSMMLLQPQFDACADSVVLTWTAYKNFYGGLKGYRVYYKENDDVFLPLALVNDTVYVHRGLANNIKYSYFVRAEGYDGSRTSTTVIRSLHVRKPERPSFEYLKYVTVVNNSYVELQLWPDSLPPVQGYHLLRSENLEGPYGLLAQLDSTNIKDVFIDSTAQVSKQQYYYKVDVFDSCNVNTLTSNVMNSIFLRNAGSGLLSWNTFDGYENGVETYQVYREMTGSTEKIADLGPFTTEFLDPSYTPDLSAAYYVVAVEADGNQFGFKELSTSNKITLDAEFRLFVPNAITPARSTNNIFLPKAISFDASEFYMAIFHRCGMRIFETTDYTKGWDGKINGAYVSAGAYVYYIRLLTLDGRFMEQRGLVVVVD
jgi:hypothetical protein